MDNYIDNIESTEKNLEYLMEHHKEIYDTYANFGKLIHTKGGPLDERTRWLIKIALSTSCQYEHALKTHILKAMKAGCTEKEIEHAILLVAPTVGFPRMMRGLMAFRELLDKE
jgi:4-carboxymuconolactone decarboxylase